MFRVILLKKVGHQGTSIIASAGLDTDVLYTCIKLVYVLLYSTSK